MGLHAFPIVVIEGNVQTICKFGLACEASVHCQLPCMKSCGVPKRKLCIVASHAPAHGSTLSAQGYAAALSVAGQLPRMSLLGAPNNAGARAALIADMAAAAASVGEGGADGALSPTLHAPPAKARDSDLPAAGLWRSDGTICEGATAGGPAALLFVPRPPANIHHALKRQRRLLSPKDVPRLWTLPRIAAELILALADKAVREERRARDAIPSPSHGPASGKPKEPAAQVHVVASATAGGDPVVSFATGSSEVGDMVGNPDAVLLAPEPAGGLQVVHEPSTPPAQSRSSCGSTSASAAASAVPAQGDEPAGPAPCRAAVGGPSLADTLSAVDSAGTGSRPRSAAAAGAAAAVRTSSQGSNQQGGTGESLRANLAAAGGPGRGGAGVAQQLAQLVRGSIGAADVAAADALVLEVRARGSRGSGAG